MYRIYYREGECVMNNKQHNNKDAGASDNLENEPKNLDENLDSAENYDDFDEADTSSDSEISDLIDGDDSSEFENTIDFDDFDEDEQTVLEEDQALWSKQFSEEPYLNDDGVPSRVQKRKADNKLPNNLVTVFIVIIFIIIITTVAYVWYLNNRSYDRFENDPNSVEVISNEESIEESIRLAEEESNSIEEEESRSAEESQSIAEEESRQLAEQSEAESLAAAESVQQEQAQAAEQSRAAAESAAEASRQAAQETQQSQAETQAETETETETETAGRGSYTVQAQDSLYRIAVNHGISLEELTQMNGITPGTAIHPGTTLIVPE